MKLIAELEQTELRSDLIRCPNLAWQGQKSSPVDHSGLEPGGKMGKCLLMLLLLLPSTRILPNRQDFHVAKISFRDPIKNFGAVVAGEKLRYGFEFTNAGNKILEIYSIVPS